MIIAWLIVTGCNSNRADDPEMQAFVKKIKSNLVFVEGGSFMMGDVEGEHIDENGNKFISTWTGDRDNKPAHKVSLDSYSMQKYETTYGEYDYFCEVTGHEIFKAKQKKKNLPRRQSNQPVWGIQWQPAQDYCHWLGEVTGLPFDLPSEAQWEYAARSRGQNVAYATDNGKIDFGRNYRGEFSNRHPEQPGTFPANPLGLHEMTGNVREWVKDWYQADYYQHSPEQNPPGPETGQLKIVRGGGLEGSAEYNVLNRRAERPVDRRAGGIRCVVNAQQPVN
ncbi:MAG: SUMF1/EgtB/PvdO family nonheme iron enzyme [Thermodesulfobacteriota bacterium]